MPLTDSYVTARHTVVRMFLCFSHEVWVNLLLSRRSQTKFDLKSEVFHFTTKCCSLMPYKGLASTNKNKKHLKPQISRVESSDSLFVHDNAFRFQQGQHGLVHSRVHRPNNSTSCYAPV
jgi:hypothetical protein